MKDRLLTVLKTPTKIPFDTAEFMRSTFRYMSGGGVVEGLLRILRHVLTPRRDAAIKRFIAGGSVSPGELDKLRMYALYIPPEGAAELTRLPAGHAHDRGLYVMRLLIGTQGARDAVAGALVLAGHTDAVNFLSWLPVGMDGSCNLCVFGEGEVLSRMRTYVRLVVGQKSSSTVGRGNAVGRFKSFLLAVSTAGVWSDYFVSDMAVAVFGPVSLLSLQMGAEAVGFADNGGMGSALTPRQFPTPTGAALITAHPRESWANLAINQLFHKIFARYLQAYKVKGR
ncbi:unnamed protein product [Scytosiphon promiscuus]